MIIFAHDSWVMGIDGWERRGKLRSDDRQAAGQGMG